MLEINRNGRQDAAMLNWINIGEAITQTGNSDRTIRRWIKSNESNPLAVKKDGKNTYINANELAKKYPLKENQQFDRNGGQEGGNRRQTEQMQIVSHTETIKELSKQIERRDEEIKLLLHRKPTFSKWIVAGFICFFLIISGLFAGYRYEQRQIHAKELSTLEDSFKREIKAQIESEKEALLYQQIVVGELQTENARQRLELAEKDRLISELYNDTKAQNKKLLELTESLQSKSVKNDQLENNSVKNEPQKD